MPSLRAGFIGEAIPFYKVTHCEEIASAKRRLAMTRQTGFSNTLLDIVVEAQKDSDCVKTLGFVIASAAKQSLTPIRARAGIASLRSQ